jgi:hypothetical protein
MKWIYHPARADYMKDGEYNDVAMVYLRPVWIEDKQELTSGVVVLRIISINYVDQMIANGKFSDEEINFLNPIREKVRHQDYFIEETQLEEDEHNHILNKADIYVAENFDRQKMLMWLHLFLTIQGYPFTNFEESDYQKFANDVNPILRIFSLDNVKKFESEFGAEWWKSTYKKKPDQKAIELLLKQINKN